MEEEPRKYYPLNCWGPMYIMDGIVRDKLLQVFRQWSRNVLGRRRIEDAFSLSIIHISYTYSKILVSNIDQIFELRYAVMPGHEKKFFLLLP